MKIVEIKEFKSPKVKIQDMLEGQVGQDDDGDIFIRLWRSAICLTTTGKSFVDNAEFVNNKTVTLFPTGTKITIEVDK